MTLVGIGGAVLGAIWLASGFLKVRRSQLFRRDLEAWMPHALVGAASYATILAELGVGVISMVPALRSDGARASILLLLVFTASFVPRAAQTGSMECSCFGSTPREYDSSSESLREEARQSWVPAWVAARNGAMIAIASAVAGLSVNATLGLWALVLGIMLWATTIGLVQSRVDRVRSVHPRALELQGQRRIIFATTWASGLHTEWLSCLDSGPRLAIECHEESEDKGEQLLKLG